jgi:hypothetical protein
VVDSPLLEVFSGGELNGSGLVVSNVENGGHVMPGSVNAQGQPVHGVLDMIGAYTEEAAGTLTIRVRGGADQPGAYDWIYLVGAATPAGRLVLDFSDDALGDAAGTYHFLRAENGIAGNWSTVEYVGIDPARVVLHPELGQFIVAAAGCDADLNGDGQVTLADLAILLSNFGDNAAAPGDGDIDGDQSVSLADLAFLLSRYGTFCR